jgi:hypothetical protein
MHSFIHAQNLKRFRELLEQECDPELRAQIERLLKEEEDRDVDELDATE